MSSLLSLEMIPLVLGVTFDTNFILILSTSEPRPVSTLLTLYNSALRVVTGCDKKTPIDHLREEIKLLPIHDYLSLITCSYYVPFILPETSNLTTLPKI